VVASSASADARRISATFSDAVAEAMEDVGVTRAAAVMGGAAPAVRSASDLLDGKAEANGAAFAFELLARLPLSVSIDGSDSLYDIAIDLYAQGPTDRAVWERAGGDPSTLPLDGTGRSSWWSALRELDRGGGLDITEKRLLVTMLEDCPDNAALRSFSGK